METFEETSFTSVTRPKNLSSQIEEQILVAINRNVFAVDDYLPSENKLVKIFNVSRGVIREALLMLSAKGVVEIQKGKGAKVLNPSMDLILDPFSSLVNFKCGNHGFESSMNVRILIEPHVTKLAAENRTDEDLKKLHQIMAKMEEYVDDRKQINMYDVNFHKAISVACGNPMFSVILEPIFHFLRTYHRESLIGTVPNEITIDFHHKILSAVEAKNGKEASQAMYEHLTFGTKKD